LGRAIAWLPTRIESSTQRRRSRAVTATQTALSFVRRTSFSPLPQLFVYDREAIDALLRAPDRMPRGNVQTALEGCLSKVPADGYILDVGSSKRMTSPGPAALATRWHGVSASGAG